MSSRWRVCSAERHGWASSVRAQVWRMRWSGKRAMSRALGIVAPTLSGSVSLNSARALAQDDRGEHHVAIAAGADLVLPLALTALAQRLPGGRRRTAGETRSREATPALV